MKQGEMLHNYGSNKCWLCLCEVCTRMHCLKVNRRYSMDFCISMLLRKRCPVVKCEDFQHKQKYKVYRVVKRERKTDRLVDRLKSLEARLDSLLKKL